MASIYADEVASKGRVLQATNAGRQDWTSGQQLRILRQVRRILSGLDPLSLCHPDSGLTRTIKLLLARAFQGAVWDDRALTDASSAS